MCIAIFDVESSTVACLIYTVIVCELFVSSDVLSGHKCGLGGGGGGGILLNLP